MDQHAEITNLLRKIQATQLKEAKLAEKRWTIIVVIFILYCMISIPAALSYLLQA